MTNDNAPQVPFIMIQHGVLSDYDIEVFKMLGIAVKTVGLHMTGESSSWMTWRVPIELISKNSCTNSLYECASSA